MDIRNLEGRVAVVTGAASGIGRETALLFARLGADLAICYIDEAGLKATADRIEQLNRKALQARVDVADSDSMSEFADRVFAELGRVDVLVNNAGIGTGGPFVEVPLHEWDTILGINLKGVVNGCHVFVPRMIEARHPAHVINIASMAGYIALPGMSAYSATKFAVIGLSESLRAELAVYQIGVTAICPGTEIEAQRFAEHLEAALGRHIGGVVGECHFGVETCHVDDAAAAGRDHRTRRSLAQEERRPQVRCVGLIPVALRDLQNIRRPRDAGIVDQYVEPPRPRDNGLDELFRRAPPRNWSAISDRSSGRRFGCS